MCSVLAGTDEKAIVDILGYRTNDQRQNIKMMYKTCFGRVSAFFFCLLVFIFHSSFFMDSLWLCLMVTVNRIQA